MEGKFLDPLELEYIDGRVWKLTSPFDYHLGSPTGLDFVRIPAGFLTDFASVPRFFWRIFPPTGQYGKAAVVHDWLYQNRVVIVEWPDGHKTTRLVERSEADGVLYEAMGVLGVDRFTRWGIYAGVRVGGWVAWRKYRSAD